MPRPPPPAFSPQDLRDYYQYFPSIGGNAFFMVSFYLFFAIFLWRVARLPRFYPTWLIMVFALAEGGGYTARLVFAKSAGNLRDGFLAQIIILVIAPNLAQAYLYSVTGKLADAAPIDRKHLMKRRSWSVPAAFVIADLGCLVVQSIAGSQLGSSSASQSSVNTARTVMLVGLSLQLGCLAVFLLVLWRFFQICPRAALSRARTSVIALSVGVALVVVRNTYRVAEFASGSIESGKMGKHEVYYFLGDPVLMWLFCALFVVVDFSNPGLYEQLAAAPADTPVSEPADEKSVQVPSDGEKSLP